MGRILRIRDYADFAYYSNWPESKLRSLNEHKCYVM